MVERSQSAAEVFASGWEPAKGSKFAKAPSAEAAASEPATASAARLGFAF